MTKTYVIAKLPVDEKVNCEVYLCIHDHWTTVIDHAKRMTLQDAHSQMIYLGEDGYEIVRLADDDVPPTAAELEAHGNKVLDDVWEDLTSSD